MRFKQRFFSPRSYVPKFYGYARFSHRRRLDKFDKVDSVADQEIRIRAFFEMLKAERILEWGGMFSEPLAQSAHKRRFSRRPAGRELVAILRPGDQLCVDRYYRLFRDMEDFAHQRRWFAERGIGLHIVSFLGLSMDANSLGAEMMFVMYEAFGEFESQMKSELVRAAKASLRSRGRHDGAKLPKFCQLVDCPPGETNIGRRMFLPWALPAMDMIEDAVDSGRKLSSAIDEIKEQFGVRLNRNYASDLYWFTKAYKELGQPDINTLNWLDVMVEYKQAHCGTDLDPRPPATVRKYLERKEVSDAKAYLRRV